MTICIFTHTDLDGVISGLFLQHYYINQNQYDKSQVPVFYCSTGKTGNLYSTIQSAVQTHPVIDKIFITDISPDAETMQWLMQQPFSVQVIDHHESALPLAAQYTQNIINQPKVMDTLTCAATLVYDYLSQKPHTKQSLLPKCLADITRSYDTWDWQNDPHDAYGAQARDFDGLLYLFGKQLFISRTLAALKTGNLMSDEDKQIMELQSQRNETYINMCLSHVKYILLSLPHGAQVSVGIVTVNRLMSEVGNAILQTIDPNTNEKCHLAILFNNGSLSFRSDDQIDSSKVAAVFGGGGHPKASGAQIAFDPTSLIQAAVGDAHDK